MPAVRFEDGHSPSTTITTANIAEVFRCSVFDVPNIGRSIYPAPSIRYRASIDILCNDSTGKTNNFNCLVRFS
jgi:hypothetical protein